MRNAATIAAAWNILSASAYWWRNPDQLPIKPKGRDSTREGSLDPSSHGDQAKGTPRGDTQGIGHCTHSLLESWSLPPMVWDGKIAKVRINGESCMALLNNGTWINTIMLSFVEDHSFDVGPLSDLVGRQTACVGLGNALTWPLDYIIIQVQVDRVQGYDED